MKSWFVDCRMRIRFATAWLVALNLCSTLPARAYIPEYLPQSLQGCSLAPQRLLLAEISCGQRANLPGNVVLNNSDEGLILSGRANGGRRWKLQVESIGLGGTVYSTDLDRNGSSDLLITAGTGACGIAPPARLLILLFDSDGWPRAYQLTGYFRAAAGGSALEDVIVSRENGARYLIVQQLIYANTGGRDRNYWRWHLYGAENGRLRSAVATIQGTRLPTFTPTFTWYTEKPNHKVSAWNSWLEQRTQKQHHQLEEINVTQGE